MNFAFFILHFPKTHHLQLPIVASREFCRSLKLQLRSLSVLFPSLVMFLCNQSLVGVALCVSTALAGVVAPRDGRLHLPSFEVNFSKADSVKEQRARLQCLRRR